MSTINTTTTRVHKSDLSTLKSGDTFSTRFGIVRLDNDSDGHSQHVNVTVIDAREDRAENGESMWLRYTKLSFIEQTIELDETDLDEQSAQVIETIELTIPQFMYLEACKPEHMRQTVEAITRWTWKDRLALTAAAASVACVHMMIATLFN